MDIKQSLNAQLIEETRDLVLLSSGNDFAVYADRIKKTIFNLSEYYKGNHDSAFSLQKGNTSIHSDLLTKSSQKSIIEVIQKELEDTEEFYIASAFISIDILNLFAKTFEKFISRGGKIRLLTSIMNRFNNPDALSAVQEKNIDLRVYFPGANQFTKVEDFKPSNIGNFHIKCFLFKKKNAVNSIIVGSSNFTYGGMKYNHEWNYFSNFEAILPRSGNISSIFANGLKQFNKYWGVTQSVEPNNLFYEFYRKYWQEGKQKRDAIERDFNMLSLGKDKPRDAQTEALEKIKNKRLAGIKKTAVIAATGLGKTHLVAFDFKASEMENILFVAHRESILRSAQKTFQNVCGEKFKSIVLSGNTSDTERERMFSGGISVFAMIQTLTKSVTLDRFENKSFEYIVVDEFHHAEAATYKKALDYFESEFFLGLTATPERMDGKDILEFCNNDIAYEKRLLEAIEKKWLSPFQYYAIYDQTDFEEIRWTGRGYDENELEKKLSNDTRVDLIVNNLKRYVASSGKRKVLAFCSNVGHARYMSKMFNAHGFSSTCVTGATPTEEREIAIDQLQDENHELQIICSVDVFGEGVDIPELSHVLLLRPTQSFTVFLQQLGRGLRKTEKKDFCVVLDFIGNYRKSYISPLGLKGAVDLTKTPNGNKDFRLPESCFIDADEEVKRIWDDEIKRIQMPRNEQERLIEVYNELRESITYSPSLMDFFANITVCDPQKFINKFGSWLQTKNTMGDLTEYERSILNSSGEEFLLNLEKGLNPNKSYKMVVLQYLLSTSAEKTRWDIKNISKWYKQFYLENLEYLPDFKAMYRQDAPEHFSDSKVRSHLLKFPLYFLSNKSSDSFILDRENGHFSLKQEYHQYWKQRDYRVLVKDRVEFALKRYFHGKNLSPDYQKLNRIFAKLQTPQFGVIPKQSELISLPFYPDLKIACGTFDGGSFEIAHESMEVENQRHKLDPKKHFILRASGDSMNGGRTPIRDGDLLLMEMNQGGSISNQIFGVQYQDDFGDLYYVLKKIEKDKNGNYTLVPTNSNFKKIEVNLQTMRPFARFKYLLNE